MPSFPRYSQAACSPPPPRWARAGLEAPRQVVPLRAVDPDLLDHLAAAPGRLELVQHLAAPVEHADARGPEHLVAGEGVEVGAERVQVEWEMRHRLGAVEQHERAGPMGALHDPRHRVDRAEDVGDVRDRHDARARREQPVEGFEVEVPLSHHRDRAQHRPAVATGHLPRDQVRVVLELAHDDLVARLKGPAHRLRHQVDPLGSAAREDDLLAAPGAHEGAHCVPGRLVPLGGFLTQGVDGAVHVGVAGLVVVRHRLDHRERLLAGGGRVEIHERVPVHDAGQDRKVAAGFLAQVHRVTS
jgi:hypothetical protein